MRRPYPLLFFLLLISNLSHAQQESVPLQFDVSGYGQQQGDGEAAQRWDSSALDTVPSIKAEMNVNEAGSLSYLVPIEVLKGVNDFQPNLALAYNSQSGNGLAGWGWNLAGLSMITGGGKSKHIDGITIGPQYLGQDPFYLDGQRLLEISATDFVTEKYSKIKITRHPAGSQYSFTVQYTDGKIAKYKELTPGQHYISVLTGSLDNEVHYAYTMTGSVPVVSSISYGGSSASNDKFSINFIYANRTVPTKSYRNGLPYTSSKVLSEIEVKSSYIAANNGLYRKYRLYFDRIQSNTTERLIRITIENENGATLKPLKFNYNSATYGTLESYGSSISNWPYLTTGLGSIATGDFYGTGNPYPVYETKESETSYKLYNPKSGVIDSYTKSRDYFAGRVLRQNKISETDDLIGLHTEYPGGTASPNALTDRLTFKATSLSTGYGRTVLMDLKGGINETNNTRDERPRYLVSGDLNNDGLVDLLIFERANQNRPQKVYFAQMGLLPAGTAVPATVPCPVLGIDDKTNFHLIEFDGDGIPEILVINRTAGKYTILKLDPLGLSLTAIAGQSNITLANFTEKTPIIFGDFNGDGLTDFITPQRIFNIEGSTAASELQKMESEALLWWHYTSTGKTFSRVQKNYTQQKLAYIATSQRNVIKKSTDWDKFWSGTPDRYQHTEYATSTIIAADFNNDGKTDLISVRKFGKAKYDESGWLARTSIQPLAMNSANANKIFFHETRNLSDGSQTLGNLSTTVNLDNEDISPLSLILNYSDYNHLNTYKTGLLIHDPVLREDSKFIINNDNFIEGQLREVDNGSPVRQSFEYKPMAEKHNNFEEDAYTTESTSLTYPYYVHKNVGVNYLVYKTHTLFDGNAITTEYRYRNGVQHLGGRGFLGFQKTYVSDPYESILENGKYRMKDILKAHFWKTSTFDPLLENALVSTAYGSLNMNSIFSLSVLNSARFDKGGNRYLILTTSETSKDYLKEVTIAKSYEYDVAGDLLLKKITTGYNTLGSSIEEFTYGPESLSGQHYHFGQIIKTENTVWRGSASFNTKEEQSFNPNGTISQAKKYGNATVPIITDFAYYPFGGVQSQTVSAQGISPVATHYEYDNTNRFVWKITDAEGMVSTANVNATGRILSEVSSLGLTTSYKYDNWGNVKEATDYLGKKTFTAKNITPDEPLGYYSISVKKQGGAESLVIKDIFDRTVKTKNETVNGQWVVKATEYDIFGKKIRESEPYFEGDLVLWNTVEYDEISRPIKHTSYTGKVATTCYEGLKVTVEDGHKKLVKLLDAMGNVIMHQDGGGKIFYKYFPNGALKESDYDGIVTKFEIDGWGSKTKLIDPSAGTYIYEYDNFSRLKKEINPKGGYTEYLYDNFGKIITENTVSSSENTNIFKNYSYDATTKLPTVVSGTYNGKAYTYTTLYNDPYHRISGKKEDTPNFTYQSTFTYDDYGRLDATELKTTISNPNYVTISNVKNNYDNLGLLTSQTDMETSTLIWELGEINSHGLPTRMEYGNGYTLNTTYNGSNLSLEKIKHHREGEAVVDIEYNFDVQKGVLLERRNLVFDKNENFEYDELDRLLTEAVNGSTVHEYSYDKRGRMTSSSEIGTYDYNGQNYRLKSINFNDSGATIATGRGFAEIQYNSFKNPYEVFLQGKDRISYEFSILKKRSASYYGSLDTNPEDRPYRKFYSSDMSIEILRENNTVKIITYITGDPYTANYMKVDIVSANGLSGSGKYFIHRDNQNTIVAITDSFGNITEQRYFDAWGNLKEAIRSGNGDILLPNEMGWIDSLLIDRGYTGHEHLKTVGLIHMNGRIYDPALRRFLSPDNYVQDAYNTQNFNRYAYALNNPLLYTDPSGEYLIAALIGLAVAVVINGITNSINNIPFWYGAGKSGMMGAIGGVISFGIGSLATSSFTSTINQALFQAGMHAYTGAIMGMANGGDFLSGFAAGAVSSLLSSAIQYIGSSSYYIDDEYTQLSTVASRNPGLFKAAMIASGGLGGGLSSAIAGGKFWVGAQQGLLTSGLNHAAHQLLQEQNVGQATIEVTDEIVGKTKIQSMGEIYETDLYKMVVSGYDAEGNTVSKDFEVVRFGMKNGKVSYLAAGKYHASELYISKAMGNLPALRIKGPYAIHMMSANSIDSNFGCIAIAGGANSWNNFIGFMKQITFANNLNIPASNKNIIVNIVPATIPKNLNKL